MKQHKYKAKKTNGYDSKREYNRSVVLKMLEKQGTITDLHEQVQYILCPKQTGVGFNRKEICLRREMSYIADFVYVRDGVVIVEDTKGYKTAEYKRKKRLMKMVHGIEIFES